jgi:hypothetical protein
VALNHHDTFRHLTSQNVAFNSAGAASVQSNAFSTQTYWIRVVTNGVVTATNTGVRIAIGANPVAASTSALLPLNWVEPIRVNPGEKIAALSNGVAGTLNVVELTD